MSEVQIKSRERVANHGEVFTSTREVKAMCDLVKDETERIDSRFLEPACGDGNFLAEIIERKLKVVTNKYSKSPYDWERNSLLALGSIYGVDILLDNCMACRERLFLIWDEAYRTVCKKECNDETRKAARFILSLNIVCGNALSLRCVDENQHDTSEPIIFSKWSFPRNDAFIYRKDYAFAELLTINSIKEDKEKEQMSIFDFDDEEDDEKYFIREYKCRYRRLGENE